MNWATRRKLMYASVVIGFFVVIAIIIALYFVLSKKPSCFDGVQNQDERGVDCGGVCDLVCSQDTLSVLPIWTQVAPVRDTIYHAVSYIENQNAGSGAASFSYKFSIYDKENILIAEREGNTYLGPNARTAVFESGIDLGNREPALAFFQVTQPIRWQKAPLHFSQQLITIEETEAFNIYSEPKITARIRNESIYLLESIDLVALVFDASNNLIATSSTFVESLRPGSVKDIFFTWPEAFNKAPARVEIIPRYNPFTQPRVR